MSEWKENLRSWNLLQWIFALGLSLVAIGISWSVFLVSNSVIILSLLIPFMQVRNRFYPALNANWKKDLGQVYSDPLLLSMLLFFGSQLLSGYWSDQTRDWIWFCRMLLPFLLLPLVFYQHSYSHTLILKWAIGIFLISCFISSLAVAIDYLRNAEIYNIALLRGKPIVTHISHIRYSMMMAMSAMICLHLFFIYRKKNKTLTTLALILCFYFFVFNHLLSAKTGLFSMYFAGIAYLFSGIPDTGRKLKIGVIFVLAGMALLCFLTIPSLQQKFYYTWWQIGEFSRGKWLNYSDIERWVSILMGIEMIKQEPFFGFGLGDLYIATANIYQECLSNENYKLPHNQFIFTWAFTGLFGFFSLLSLIWFSFLQKKWIQHPLIFSVQIILWSSFFVEYTLGTQIGCSLYVYSTLISWGYLRMQNV